MDAIVSIACNVAAPMTVPRAVVNASIARIRSPLSRVGGTIS
jgi:hypothetical protein